MNKTVLFIGGPIDGLRRQLETPLSEKLAVPYDDKAQLKDCRLDLAATQNRTREAVYELRSFTLSDTNLAPVYCFKPLTNEHVMALLLEGYRQPA